MDDFESILTRELHQLVDGEIPSPELRERIAHDLSSPPAARSRRWMPAAAAALLVIAGIGAIMSTRSDDGGVDVATDPEPGAVVLDDEADRDGDRDTTPTTALTATTVTTTAVTDTTVAPPPDDETPPPPVAPADPGSGPATTVPQCQNSTDPSCGPFHWSPEPTNQPATLTLSVPDRVVAGQPVTVTMSMADPDGPVSFGCYDLGSNAGSPQISGPCVVERCPDRYGPWSPPAPKASQGSIAADLTFDEPGTYVLRGNVIPDGCDNVNPYLSGATAEITVEVVAE